MHSLKNTIIAVGLLGLSFVFYQMSAPDQSGFEDIASPVVTDLRAELADAGDAAPLQLPSLKSPFAGGNGLRNPLASGKPPAFSLPSPRITNPLAAPLHAAPLAAPRLSQPTLTPPAPTRPNDSFGSEQPKLQPRPEAKFDFTKKSGPALTPPSGIEQRDQSLIAALKKQQQATDESQAMPASKFKANAFVTQEKTPAQSASFIRDEAVVAASKVDRLDASNGFALQPATIAASDPYAGLNFKTVWPTVETLVNEEGKFRKALQLLTRFYDSPGLNGPQQQRLNGWLDGLATKVVFSNEHHLSPAYISEPGDSYLELGRKWGVPGQLIYNVNKYEPTGPLDSNANQFKPVSSQLGDPGSLRDPLVLVPGTELKKIMGPVDAKVDLSSNTMTLFVEGLYAGRFIVAVGVSGSPQPGDYKVVGKLAGGYEWKDASGTYAPGHPNNHYGKYFIAMEGSLCMHAVPAKTTDGHRGCLGLSEKDAADVFSILSEGSTISIR